VSIHRTGGAAGSSPESEEYGPPPGVPEAPKRDRRALLRILVSAALLIGLFALVDLDRAREVLLTARPDFLLLMFLAMVLERLFAAWRWQILLRLIEPAMPFWPVLRVTLVGNFVGTFLPGGVGIEVIRIWGLSRYLSDLPLALSSVVVERLLGLLALLLMVGLGVLLAPVALPLVVELIVVLGILGLLAATLLVGHPRPRMLVRGLLVRVRRLERLRRGLLGLEGRLDAFFRRPLALLVSLGLAFLFQGLRVVTVLLGAIALNIAVEPAVFAVVVPLGILIALLPISIGGLGPREATYVGLLGLAGVDPAAALVLSLTREVMNLLTALPGAVLYARGPFQRRAEAE